MKSAMFTMSMCAFSGTFVWAISGAGMLSAGQVIGVCVVGLVQMFCAVAYFE